jgi:hypothetical protein
MKQVKFSMQKPPDIDFPECGIGSMAHVNFYENKNTFSIEVSFDNLKLFKNFAYGEALDCFLEIASKKCISYRFLKNLGFQEVFADF